MAFARYFQDGCHLIIFFTVFTLDFFSYSRCLTEQFPGYRFRQHDLLRIFLQQGRIASHNGESEYIKESCIDKCIVNIYGHLFCTNVIFPTVLYKGRILHLRKFFPECFTKRSDGRRHLTVCGLLFPDHPVDIIAVLIEILKCQFIHNP